MDETEMKPHRSTVARRHDPLLAPDVAHSRTTSISPPSWLVLPPLQSSFEFLGMLASYL